MPDEFDPDTVSWVLDKAGLRKLCGSFPDSTRVVMDLETTSLNAYTWWEWKGRRALPRIALASFTIETSPLPKAGPSTFVLPLSHPDSVWRGQWRKVMRTVARRMVQARVRLSNQNVKHDAEYVHGTTGVDLSRLIDWDTRVAEHMLDENDSTALKVRAPKVFGVEAWDEFDLSQPGAAERVPLIDLGMYAARDTYWAWRLDNRERRIMVVDGFGRDTPPPSTPDEVELRKLGDLARYCNMPAVASLTAIEQRGMLLDQDWTKTELIAREEVLREEREVLVYRYGEIPGEPSFEPNASWWKEWLRRAVEAHDLDITARTKKGTPSFTKGVLKRQARAGSETAQHILDYRAASKQAQYLRSWLGYVGPDSRIHATYNTGWVVTGRLSASDPNVQQITAVLKPAFPADEGYYIVEIDYGQIEMRTAAHISQCEPMIEALRRGDDLHALLGTQITGLPLDQITPEVRQTSKSANFGLLFAMSAFGFREYALDNYDVALTMDEAEAIHDAFYTMWDGMADWHLRAIARARSTGQVSSPLGRVRRLPDINSHVSEWRATAERQAINSPVQGMASDIMQMAAASISGYLPGHSAIPDIYLIATIHDSIVGLVPVERWEEPVKLAIERMIHIDESLHRLGCHFSVPLAAEAKVGTRWGMADIATL